MKKFLLSAMLVFSLMLAKLNAQGIWASGFTATVNGITTNFGLQNPAILGSGTMPTSLGTLSTLVLNGGTIITYKDAGQNICSGTLWYALYPTGSRPASLTYSSIALAFANNCTGGTFPRGVAIGKACTVGKDQQWSDVAQNKDLAATLTANGNYTLEIYFQATGSSTSSSDCGQSFYDNNAANPSNYTITFDYVNNTLPVSLIGFSAIHIKHSNLVQWHTAKEENIQSFDLLASHDGQVFDKIAFIPAKGSNTDYQFVDDKNYSFYRLLQMDNDGNKQYSEIIHVGGSAMQTIKVFPNPAKNVLNVLGGIGVLKLYNSTGKIILQQYTVGAVTQVNVSKLPKGVYFIHIGSSVTKFIKQ